MVRNCEPTTPSQNVVNALADDLNTPLAISHIYRLRNEVAHGTTEPGVLLASLRLLGHFHFQPTVGSIAWGQIPEEQHAAAMSVARHWMNLRQSKNFGAADILKQAAAELGVELSVSNEEGRQRGFAKLNGPVDVSLLEALK